MTSSHFAMNHLTFYVYNNSQPLVFGILVPSHVTGDMRDEMVTLANALVDLAKTDFSLLMDILLEISERHICFRSMHDGRDMTTYKFVLAEHCKDHYLNGLLTQYHGKVGEFEKIQ